MFKKNIFILCCLISYSLLAQQEFTGTLLTPQIIPEPVKIEVQHTYLPFYNQITLEFRKFSNENRELKEVIEKSVQKFQINNSSPKNSLNIQFILNDKMVNNIKKEGYHLAVQKSGIVVEANDQAGLFYGLQTLLQILPIKQDNNVRVTHIPYMDIIDYPRFAWRGLMLDVSRHFFNKQEVLKFIDNMVRYKYNILHLHLSDDEGWRIEIKSLPKLTEVGAWRAKRTGKWANTKDAFEYEPKEYGGFYTQEDMKEIIKYAQQRFVQIVPEIDVPGHSMALLAAYPFLSCSQENAQVHIGTPFIDWDKYPFLVAYKDNSVNPANPLVYEYMDKIFTEIAQLFPFEYIHIGGDECVKNYWDNNKEVKNLMAKENLHNSEEVQAYFTKKILHLIQLKNKKIIGWDEILEGGLDSNAAVMSWRGEVGGIKASNEKHKVVMTPAEYCYLDYYQGEKMAEPPVYRGLRL
ncbi:MAG: beta-N-acetylhexosaminidase, partial [Sediminibacterium sp.]|nr:beta-N-acetylhexosaminidase [Sediminibacterium sp.]